MRIIICGAGRVGQGIAQRLAADNHVTIIDENPELIDQVANQYEVNGIVGHAAHPGVLRKAGAESAEMIIAVTHSDEVNMITCQVAHSLFKITTKIARIRSQAYLKPTYAKLFTQDNLPVDMHISPEIEVGNSIIQRYLTPGAFLTAELAEGAVKFLGIELSSRSSFVGATLKDIQELFDDDNLKVVALARREGGQNKVWAPHERDTLNAGDRIYVVAAVDSIDKLFRVLGTPEEKGQTVVIVGGGNIGLYVAEALEKRGLSVRVIEGDEKRAEAAAEKLRRSIVIHGDGLNSALLEEAGVGPDSTVIGLTSDDKANLLLGALCKNLNAQKVVALVNDQDLTRIGPDLDVDVIVDPRSITVSRILLRLRQGRLTNLQTIEGGAGEVVEGKVRETSKLIGMRLSHKDDIPEGVSPGALVRNKQVMSLDEKVMQDDIVILFNEKDKMRQADLLYRVRPEFY